VSDLVADHRTDDTAEHRAPGVAARQWAIAVAAAVVTRFVPAFAPWGRDANPPDHRFNIDDASVVVARARLIV
jgi:hypothetical protein